MNASLNSPEMANPVSGYALAQSILGIDFITPEEVTKARPSIVYTAEQITALVGSLPSEDVLKWCKENDYAVMPAPPNPMSVFDVREILSVNFNLNTRGLRADTGSTHEKKTSFGWLMLKKTPVANSTSITWNEQNKLLSKLEGVPNAAEMSWFITTYFEVRGVRLLEMVYVRTSSTGSGGGHIYIGCRCILGLGSDDSWDDYKTDCIGLSAARR